MKRTLILAAIAAAALVASATKIQAADIALDVGRLHLTADPSTGTFSATTGGKEFLHAAKVGGVAFTQAAVEGGLLHLTLADGRRAELKLEGDFVLLRCATVNTTPADADFNQQPALSASLAGLPAADTLRAMGTGGLAKLDTKPGSYMYLAVAEPQSRAGVVAGWVTCDRGSGVVFSSLDGNTPQLEARVEYGRLHLKAGATEPGEWLAVGYFDDARMGLEAYADAIHKHYDIKLPPQPAGYCTWYADKHGAACDAAHLAELSQFAAKELKPFGFNFVQIDDHWQAGISHDGPKREFMRAAPDGPYPAGMKVTADQITKLGLTPGIWFIPFAGTHYDPFFQDHQDWFYKDKDGKPFAARWGGTCLDMSVPGARDYLKTLVGRLAHEWGYKVFKMDGLWTGTGTRLMYVNNGYKWDEMGEAVPADPAKTQIENFRDGLKLVRQTAGPEVFLLGCCVSQNMRSFGGAFGLVDAMRVGPDTGAGHIGAPHASRNYFLQGRVWQNDPDCVSVRAATPLDQARVNASFTAITGDLFYNSDWLPDLPPERLEILKRTMPAHGLPARPVDYFENEPARIWTLADTRASVRRDVVALFNWDHEHPVTINCPTERLGLAPTTDYVAFDFWANKFIAPFHGALATVLPPASCRVLALRPVAANPQVISTSRHVTQGMIDLTDEAWDPATQTLSGVSRVVANDPYELRIIVPVGEKSWRAVPGGTDKLVFTQDGPKIRATLAAAESSTVHWQLKFQPGPAAITAPPAIAGLHATGDYSTVTLAWDNNPADHFRIARDDGQTFDANTCTFTDATVGHGKTYHYTVTALGWGDSASAAATVEVATPAELKRPPTPPLPEVQLSTLKARSAKTGHGKIGIDKSMLDKPLTVDGKEYKTGLGVHANSLMVYAIPAGMHRFVSVVGLDDERKDDLRPAVVFEVYGDVKEMGEAPVLLAKSPVLSNKTVRSWAFDLPLDARFKELRLVVTAAGEEGIASDHADWINPGFTK